jgi:hypothetical protein
MRDRRPGPCVWSPTTPGSTRRKRPDPALRRPIALVTLGATVLALVLVAVSGWGMPGLSGTGAIYLLNLCRTSGHELARMRRSVSAGSAISSSDSQR